MYYRYLLIEKAFQDMLRALKLKGMTFAWDPDTKAPENFPMEFINKHLLLSGLAPSQKGIEPNIVLHYEPGFADPEAYYTTFVQSLEHALLHDEKHQVVLKEFLKQQDDILSGSPQPSEKLSFEDEVIAEQGKSEPSDKERQAYLRTFLTAPEYNIHRYVGGVVLSLLISLLAGFLLQSNASTNQNKQSITGNGNVAVQGDGNRVSNQSVSSSIQARHIDNKNGIVVGTARKVIVNNHSIETKASLLKSWNIPGVIDYYVERSKLIKDLKDYFQKQSLQKSRVIFTLCGLGGIGKTTIAISMLHQVQDQYEFRAWFQAETEVLLKANYFDLGTRLGLFEKDMSDSVKIRRVKEWLETRKNLFVVYDNAQNMSVLQNFLPNQGHILITSRNHQMPNAQEVDFMSDAEGLNLLKQLIPLRTDSEQEAKILLHKLGGLPLAIAQAGAYIYQNEITIADYLQTYDQQLLKTKVLPPGELHEPLYTTLGMNLQNIRKKEPAGFKLLRFIAYCYPEHIPKKLLKSLLRDNNREIFFSALNVLKEYSLIKTDTDTVSVHRLVQKFVRNTHNTTESHRILKDGVESIISTYPFHSYTKEDLLLKKQLLPHVNRIVKNMKNKEVSYKKDHLLLIKANIYEHLQEYQKSTRLYNILKNNIPNFDQSCTFAPITYAGLGYNHRRLENNQKALFYHGLEVNLKKKCFSKDSLELAEAYIHFGTALWSCENYRKAEKIYQRAQHIFSQRDIKSGHIYAKFLNGMGNLHYKKGQYKEAKKCFDQAWQEARRLYGDYHPDIAIYVNNAGCAYTAYGNLKKAKKIFEASLMVHESEYGRYNFRTCWPLHALGEIEYLLGNFAQSKKYFQETERIVSLYNVSDDLDTQNSLAVMMFQENNTKESLNKLKQVYASFRTPLRLNSRLVLTVMMNLSILYKINHLKCEILYKKALRFFLKIYGAQYGQIFHKIQNEKILIIGELHLDRLVCEYTSKIFKRADINAIHKS